MNNEVRLFLLRYGAAVIAIVAATWARLLLDPYLGDQASFLTHFFAVMAVAWYGGLGPGLTAVALGTVVVAHYFLPPDDRLLPERPGDWASLALFLSLGTAITLLIDWMHVARQRAEEDAQSVRETQALKAAIVESALDCVITIDHDGRILEFNPAAEQTFGYRRGDVLGRPIAELIVPRSHRQRHEEGLARYLATGEGPLLGQRLLMPALRSDGREFPIELAVVRVSDRAPPVFTAYLRDVSERVRVEQRRVARMAATEILAQEPEVEQALRRVLEAVCAALDWSVGCVWTLDERRQALRCRDVWRRPDDQLAPFERTTREIAFARGVGLPGRAWESGKTVWIADVCADADFPRAQDAQHAGVRGALACPVHVGGAFFGVIEFFSQELQPPDDDVLEMIATIGSQVGQFIERRRAEERLRESERLYRAIGESIDYGVWVCDPAGRNIYASESFLRLVGLTQEQCSDFGWGDVLHPEDAARTLQAWKQCVQTEGVWDIEHRFRGVDGQYHPVLARGVPVRDEEGRITCWAGINLDISGLKDAEAARHESEEQLRILSDSIPQLAWMARPNGDIFWYNQRWYDYTGASPEEMLGWGWQSVHDPQHLPRVLESFKAAIASGEPWDDTFPLRRRDGAMRWHLSRALPRKDEHGNVTCWFGTNTDISERMEMEAALQDADRRKNEFLAMLAHELRNPLTPIRSGLDVLALESGGANETVTLMQEQVEHLVRLVDDLLDVSRIVRGKIELRREPTDLCAVVRRAAAGAESAARDREQEIAVFLPDDPVYVNADAVRLVQVVGNLLHNASKYSESQTRVELRLEVEGNEAVLRVRDEGIGIEPELLPRVFDLFTQSDNSRERARGGLGIGLTLVRDLVEMHGGSVSVQSEGPGRGSEFVVRLPTTEARPQATEAPRPPQAEPLRRSLAIGRRILVVDDNIAAAKTLSMLLAGLGPHQVEIAHSGTEALAKAPEFRPEIVLLDIGMPGMNGFEVCRAMRQRPELEGALLVAVSGYGQEEDRRRAREAGFDEHMVKPPSRGDIQRVLAHRRLHERPAAVAASSREGTGGVPVASAAPAVEPSSAATPPLEERTGQFLRELAHDVGNAVYPFRLMLHILEQRGLNANSQERLVQSLRSQLPQMDRVLNQLRRAGAVIRGSVAPQPQSLEAAPALRAAAEAVRPMADEHGQHLELELSEPLPPLWADPELFQQALEELLGNAIQNTGRDGRITLQAEPEDGRVSIRVRDTGRGIDPELLPRIFEPFVRAEEKLDFQADRLGLGLAQVKRIVARHGGSVTARSPGLGEGAEFLVRWPTSQPQSAPTKASAKD